jgi:hypothetical protein
MGVFVSSLRNSLCSCLNREEKKDIETNYITPKTTEPDIEPDTSNLDYIYDNLYKEHGITSYDNLEIGTRIKYYVLTNGKRIDMI